MRRQQQRAAGCLVGATRLHADETVLHEINAADSVTRADLIQQFDKLDWIKLLSIESDRHALDEIDLDLFGAVGRLLRRLGPHPRGWQWRGVRILELAALMAD